MIIKVIMGTNTNRVTDMVDSATTLRAALESKGIDYSRGQMNLDGATLQAGDLDKTFDEMGVRSEKCFLVNAAKQDNA